MEANHTPMEVLFKGLKAGSLKHVLENEAVFLLSEKNEIAAAFNEGKLDASIGEYQSGNMYFEETYHQEQ